MDHTLSSARQRVVRALIIQRQEVITALREIDEGIEDLLRSYTTGLTGDWQFFIQQDGTIVLRQQGGEHGDLAEPAEGERPAVGEANDGALQG